MTHAPTLLAQLTHARDHIADLLRDDPTSEALKTAMRAIHFELRARGLKPHMPKFDWSHLDADGHAVKVSVLDTPDLRPMHNSRFDTNGKAKVFGVTYRPHET